MNIIDKYYPIIREEVEKNSKDEFSPIMKDYIAKSITIVCNNHCSNKCEDVENEDTECYISDKNEPIISSIFLLYIKGIPFILPKFKNKNYDPNEIQTYDVDFLIPDLYKKEKEEVEKRFNQKIIQKTTNLYKCNNCKKRETIYYTKKKSASDEVDKFHITCINCNNQWIQ